MLKFGIFGYKEFRDTLYMFSTVFFFLTFICTAWPPEIVLKIFIQLDFKQTKKLIEITQNAIHVHTYFIFSKSGKIYNLMFKFIFY